MKLYETTVSNLKHLQLPWDILYSSAKTLISCIHNVNSCMHIISEQDLLICPYYRNGWVHPGFHEIPLLKKASSKYLVQVFIEPVFATCNLLQVCRRSASNNSLDKWAFAADLLYLPIRKYFSCVCLANLVERHILYNQPISCCEHITFSLLHSSFL